MNFPEKPKSRGCARLLLIPLVAVMAALCIVGLIVLSPGSALQILNFDRRGDLETYWETIEPQTTREVADLPPILLDGLPTARPSLTPAPSRTPDASQTPAPTSSFFPTALPTNPYQAWFRTAYIPRILQVNAEGFLNVGFQQSGLFADAVWVGENYNGTPLGILEFDESAIGLLCEAYFNGCESPLLQVNRVDFRRGGMVVYGRVNTGLWWQEVGVVLLLNPDNRTLDLGGLLVNEEIYAPPEDGQLAAVLDDLLRRGNAALTALTVQADDLTLRFAQMWFDDQRFIAVLE